MTRLTMHITMDPAFDLNAAGRPVAQAGAMYTAWADAAQQIGAAIGADITTAQVKSGSPSDRPTETEIEDGYLEPLVWQMAHDNIGLLDGEWRAVPPTPYRIERLLATMRRAGLPTPDAAE